MDSEIIKKYKICGDVHKKIKLEIKEFIYPNITINKLIFFIEQKINEYIKYDSNNPLKSGIAFPTGISINNCAAHWTSNGNEIIRIKKDDVVKIDFGIHLDGYIVDSAYTHTFDTKYDKLLEASIESKKLGITLARPDMNLGDIGEQIQEIMESYELELNQTTYPIKSVRDLCGHSIGRYNIHSGKAVPNVKINYNQRIVSNEIYAIETFASNGSGIVKPNYDNCSHFMIDNKNLHRSKNLFKEDKIIFKNLFKDFYSLPFCNRWLNEKEIPKKKLKLFEKYGILKSFPPLYDIKNSFVSQFEDTVIVLENKTMVLS